MLYNRSLLVICFLCSSVQWKCSSLSRVWLCDPMNCSFPGFSVHEISQARIPEWVAISFSRGSFWLRDQTQVSCIVGRFFTIWATREMHRSSVQYYPYLKAHQWGREKWGRRSHTVVWDFQFWCGEVNRKVTEEERGLEKFWSDHRDQRALGLFGGTWSFLSEIQNMTVFPCESQLAFKVIFSLLLMSEKDQWDYKKDWS